MDMTLLLCVTGMDNEGPPPPHWSNNQSPNYDNRVSCHKKYNKRKELYFKFIGALAVKVI